MAQKIQTGTKVRYRTAGGRIRPATVTAVTNQTTLNLRIGNGATKQTVTGASKVAKRTAGAGWYQGAR